MKKIFVIMIAALCMFLTGCNNQFARDEYDDSEKIVSSSDRYAKTKSVINTNDDGFTLEIGGFDGRETVWEYTAGDDGELSFSAYLELSEGNVKLVFVDAEDNITTVAEVPESQTRMDPVGVFLDEAAVNVKEGTNRFKLVGYGAKDVKAKLSTEKSEG